MTTSAPTAAAPDAATPFAAAYEAYHGAVVGFLFYKTGNLADAEDLAAETFANAWGAWSRYRDDGKLRSWLFRIAGNLAADWYRREGVRRTVSLEAASAGDQPLTETLADRHWDEDRHCETLDRTAVLAEALQHAAVARDLPVAVALYWQGVDQDELAARLGLTEVTLRVHISRLRDRLARAEGRVGRARTKRRVAVRAAEAAV
jgi:RNA polymerase sigma-70 factor (ECF subfamily)